MAEGGSDGFVVVRERSALGREVRALFGSTRATVLLIVTAALVVLETAALTRLFSTAFRSPGETAMGVSDVVQILATATTVGVLGAFVLGAMARWTSARRDEVGAELGAKVVAHVVVGLVYGAIGVALVGVTLVAVTALEGVELKELTATPLLQAAAGSLLTYALWALIGLGVGALAGSPVAAVAVGVFWPQVESAVRFLFGPAPAEATNYLPLRATAVLALGGARPTPYVTIGGNVVGAAAVLVVYTGVIVGAGAFATSRRLPADPEVPLIPAD